MATTSIAGTGAARSDVETSTIRAISWRLIPFLVLAYFFSYLDRVNLGFAALTGAGILSLGLVSLIVLSHAVGVSAPAAALGLPTVDVDITFISITMCCHRGMVAVPITSMRLLRYRTTDLTRLAAVTHIVT